MRIPKPTDADRDRFRSLVPDERDVETKPMFGNLGAFVNGNMFMGLFGSDVGVKLDEPDRVELSSVSGSGPFGPPERPMAGYVTLPADWTARNAEPWIAKAFASAASLPPKHPKKKAEEVTVDVSTDVIIERSLDLVALYAADPKNAPEWYANIDSVQWKTEPALNVGARVAFVARFLGRRLDYTYEFVDYVPGERLVMRTTEGPFPMETTYVWIAASETATRMELRNRGEPAGFSKIAAPFMARAMRRANRKDLASLKKILESR